jgi:hypothetical protein
MMKHIVTGQRILSRPWSNWRLRSLFWALVSGCAAFERCGPSLVQIPTGLLTSDNAAYRGVKNRAR